jgi:hypothetical protein
MALAFLAVAAARAVAVVVVLGVVVEVVVEVVAGGSKRNMIITIVIADN